MYSVLLSKEFFFGLNYFVMDGSQGRREMHTHGNSLLLNSIILVFGKERDCPYEGNKRGIRWSCKKN